MLWPTELSFNYVPLPIFGDELKIDVVLGITTEGYGYFEMDQIPQISIHFLQISLGQLSLGPPLCSRITWQHLATGPDGIEQNNI